MTVKMLIGLLPGGGTVLTAIEDGGEVLGAAYSLYKVGSAALTEKDAQKILEAKTSTKTIFKM